MLGISYSIQEIAELSGALDLFQGILKPLPIHYVAFDTRTINRGEETLFIALKTDNRDGHHFIQDAIDKGVKNFLVSHIIPFQKVNYAICENVLESLQLWACYHRSLFNYPVIGITGSNGKTIVKEWLATLVEQQFQLVKSPMSYNSQLGVALSVLEMHPEADLAIIEAGISQAGEMENLWPMIRPTIGILTHMGPAHAEGFQSETEKLQEKVRLFEDCQQILLGSKQVEVVETLKKAGLPVKTVGNKFGDFLKVQKEHLIDTKTSFDLITDNESVSVSVPFTSVADRENVLLALLGVKVLGIPLTSVKDRLNLLQPVFMRMEWITDNPEITIINDSYNSDVESVRNGIQLLKQTYAQSSRRLILTDIPHLGENQIQVQTQILKEAVEAIGEGNIYVVGPVYAKSNHPHSFESTKELIKAIRYEDFLYTTILLKGARYFRLERVIPLLNPTLNATFFRINLNQLAQNFRELKSLVSETTHSMCMVKAASYGSGTWEIARVLQREGASYLGVAYASEAIELRRAGIRLPVMVMNPDVSSIDTLLQYDIEPEVSNADFLARFVRAARMSAIQNAAIHLKLETGMGRLGFVEEELPDLIHFLSQYPDIKVVSVMSHLAAANDPSEDAFSYQQIERFQRMYDKLKAELEIYAFRHILNTAGAIRFPDFSMDMVRFGIGLYGINPVSKSLEDLQLREIGSLHSTITQVRSWPAGKSIGYGRSEYLKRPSMIATVPIGYADGIPLSLGNGNMHFLVRGKKVPTVGRICMDMLMIDVTDVPEVRAGEEVVLFGSQGDAFISVEELASAASTIPYEILVRISPRVRKIYLQE